MARLNKVSIMPFCGLTLLVKPMKKYVQKLRSQKRNK